MPVGYFHVVFTLPAEVAMIAFYNKALVYDPLFKAASEAMLTIAVDPKHLGGAHRHHCCAAHMGIGHDPSSPCSHDRARRRHSP